jgi:hypothetical protein
MSLTFKFYYYPGVGGCLGKNKIKANLAQLELELGLSLEIEKSKNLEGIGKHELFKNSGDKGEYVV